MGGVWLGENTVPKLTETSEGVLLFSHGTDRSLWPGILIVSGIGIPCVVLCTFLALYAESPISPFVLRTFIFAFCTIVIGSLAWACWFVVATLIDTRSRTIVHCLYFLGRRVWVRQHEIRDGDYLAIITRDDEHGTGGFHYIYLCRSRPLYLFSAIHLPSIKPCDALIDVLDTIASRLHIENRGYVGWASMLGAWYRFLSRKTNKSLLS